MPHSNSDLLDSAELKRIVLTEWQQLRMSLDRALRSYGTDPCGEWPKQNDKVLMNIMMLSCVVGGSVTGEVALSAAHVLHAPTSETKCKSLADCLSLMETVEEHLVSAAGPPPSG